jgi:hypothetical protein
VHDPSIDIPDIPRHVEALGMLLEGVGHVTWTNGVSAITYAPPEHLACVVGRPPFGEVLATLDALPLETEVVLGEDVARGYGLWPGPWCGEPAIVHVEPAEIRSASSNHEARLLGPLEDISFDHVPPDLRGELERALSARQMAVACDAGIPVAFCYVGWETETLWDVSVDTLAGWRARGYATAAAAALMAAMRAQGKRAVWAALESNTSSLGAAARLGFRCVDRIYVYTRDTRQPCPSASLRAPRA